MRDSRRPLHFVLATGLLLAIPACPPPPSPEFQESPEVRPPTDPFDDGTPRPPYTEPDTPAAEPPTGRPEAAPPPP